MTTLLTEAERRQLILKHEGLVRSIAWENRERGPEFEDLLQEGRAGLVKAADSFNPALGFKFSTWATIRIRGEITHAIDAWSKDSAWFPKEEDAPPRPGDSTHVERIYEWEMWGRRGNARAIAERWRRLVDTPEGLAASFDRIRDKAEKFPAAFIPLTQAQRELVRFVYLDDPVKDVTQAARELGVSRYWAGKMLRKALEIMHDEINRMERKLENGNSQIRSVAGVQN